MNIIIDKKQHNKVSQLTSHWKQTQSEDVLLVGILTLWSSSRSRPSQGRTPPWGGAGWGLSSGQCAPAPPLSAGWPAWPGWGWGGTPAHGAAPGTQRGRGGTAETLPVFQSTSTLNCNEKGAFLFSCSIKSSCIYVFRFFLMCLNVSWTSLLNALTVRPRWWNMTGFVRSCLPDRKPHSLYLEEKHSFERVLVVGWQLLSLDLFTRLQILHSNTSMNHLAEALLSQNAPSSGGRFSNPEAAVSKWVGKNITWII